MCRFSGIYPRLRIDFSGFILYYFSMRKFCLSLLFCFYAFTGFAMPHHLSVGYSNPVSLIVTHKNPQDDKTNILGALSAGVQVNYAYFAPEKPFSFHGNLDVFFPYLQFSDSGRRLTNSTVGIELTAGGAYVWKKTTGTYSLGGVANLKLMGTKMFSIGIGAIFDWRKDFSDKLFLAAGTPLILSFDKFATKTFFPLDISLKPYCTFGIKF